MEKLSGINCVLSTDSMCKKVTFLGNITVSLDPSHERNSGGVMKFLDGNIFGKIIARHRSWLRRKKEIDIYIYIHAQRVFL